MERISHAPAMRCHALLVIVAASSSVADACAQTWSVTATAPFVGYASATVTSNFAPAVTVTNTLPVGPLAPGIFFHNTASLTGSGGSGSGWSRAEWTPSVPAQTAPLAFRMHTAGNGFTNPLPGSHLAATTSMSASVRLLLQAPQPTSGRLAVRYSGTVCDFGSAQIVFDIDADGTAELVCVAPNTCSGPWLLVDLPLVIPAAGKLVAVGMQNACGVSVSSHHGAAMTVEAQFFPGQAVVQVFSTVNATAMLSFEHRLDDTVHLVACCPPVGYAQASLVVFGVQPMTVPITPVLTQLVSIDAFAPAPFTASMPPMPPGSSLYCQGLVIDTAGTLRSTRSLRAYWP